MAVVMVAVRKVPCEREGPQQAIPLSTGAPPSSSLMRTHAYIHVDAWRAARCGWRVLRDRGKPVTVKVSLPTGHGAPRCTRGGLETKRP